MLLALGRAYGTTVSSLLGETAAATDPVIRAADDTSRAGRPAADGWTYQPVGGANRALQALRVHIPPRSQQDLVRTHPGEEWLYVLSGHLRLALGRTTEILAPGDAAHYDSLTPHRLAAEEAGGVDLLFVHTLLQSPAAEVCLTGASRHGR